MEHCDLGIGDGYSNGGCDSHNRVYGYGFGDGSGSGGEFDRVNGSGESDGDHDGQGRGWGYGYSNGCSNSSEYGCSFGYGHGDGDGHYCDINDGHGEGCGDGQNMLYVDHATPILAWWRLGTRKHLGELLDTTPGAVHEWPYKPELCDQGLHACWKSTDTSDYNSGPLYRVACSGWMQTNDEKLACTRRIILGNKREE